MFTFDETLTALNEIVDEYGEDYVYPRDDPGFQNAYADCVYRNTITGEPACIVGVLLDRKGLLNNQVHEGTTARQLRVVEENFSAEAIQLLDLTQGFQDTGDKTWRQSIDEAIGRIEQSNRYYGDKE